jgi:hypothetical protein
MVGMAPKILIVHTLEWANAARLALAFRSNGCIVYALCRRGHPLCAIPSVDRVYTYAPFARIRSLRAAIDDADPDLIVPCDDPAVVLMHRLYWREEKSAGSAARIRAIIERSLGRPDSYHIITTRSLLPGIAKLANVLLPRTNPVSSRGTLKEWFARDGSVAVLKADHSWGGWGVRIVSNLREAEVAFHRMTGARYFALTVKRLLWDRDPELFLQLLCGRKPVLTVQTFIRGKIANCSVACWEGDVIAGIAVEVMVTEGPTGNATVVRVVDNREMIDIARRIIRQIGGTGFFGFDFILETESRCAVLLEVNPRVTQISHLALGKGRDLPAAIRARLLGEPAPDSLAITERDLIAFFPQELRRDPASRFLDLAYHDVPYEEPALVRAFLATPSPMRRLVKWGRTIQARLHSRSVTFGGSVENLELPRSDGG